MTRHALQVELIASITSWTETDGEALRADTPLITSSRLDSLRLFQLLEWIEEQVGRTIDATTVEIAVEWDTVDRIIAFVERERERR